MKNFSISKLAEMILTHRKLLNLTQQELADKAGINRSMLCRLENQDYVPSMDQLTRLANTLQFDVAVVFIEYNPPVFHHVVPRNITVYGAGYVGLSIATLLARHHKVTLVDVIPDKVNIALAESARALRDKRIQQYFVNPRILNAGVEVMRRGDIEFKIYDKERMLIELLRFRNGSETFFQKRYSIKELLRFCIIP